MKALPKLRAPLAAAALAVAIPAMAHTEVYYAPASTYYHAPAAAYSPPPPATTYYYTPGTTYYYAPPATTTYYTATEYTAPRITVTAPYLSEDQRITSDVVDAIANDPRVSGRIGVETRANEVTLSGSTTTPGQARHAERDARGVAGVRHVTNEIRPRLGGMP